MWAVFAALVLGGLVSSPQHTCDPERSDVSCTFETVHGKGVLETAGVLTLLRTAEKPQKERPSTLTRRTKQTPL